ncbi:MAG: serine/threonine-protein kinase, partial [Planctomycetota bacterium]|nr:serine/threonine-protein kinase [Planctomycetota bacterium]
MHDEGQTSRLEALFDQAIELPSDQRRSFLTEKCGDDLELLRQLEALLSHVQEVPGDFLEAPLPLPPMHDATSTIESGQVIGNHFRLLRRLGEGGMGIVFLAEQDSPRRQVALKVIRPGIISRQSLRRFEFEHETLGRLHHPGIAQIYEAGLHASNDDPESTTSQPYFAMEYVLGPSLLDYVQENQLTIKAKLRLFVKICRAVQHAHQHGVIHRDLKPGNILVVDEASDPPETSFDDVGQPKILD